MVSGMRKWHAGKWHAGFFISVAAVCVVPGRKDAKVQILPGYTWVFPGMPAKYRVFADFADFASKKALPLALISVTQVLSDTTF